MHECGSHLLKPLIEVIKPKKLIVTLGKHAYESVMRLYGKTEGKFTDAVDKAVARKRPLDLGDDLRLFPVFIPGGQGFIGRSSAMQERDWRSIGEYLETL